MKTHRPETFNALIIAEDPHRRARLKQAIHADQVMGMPTFGKVFTSNSLADALQQIIVDPEFELILITDTFNKLKVEEFLENLQELREEKYGLIVVLKPENQTRFAVAQDLIGGADGCLCEPFSVDGLQEITGIAAKVRKQNQEKRIGSAADLVIEAMLNTVDYRADELADGRKDKPFPSKIRAAASMFRDSSEETTAIFFENLISATAKRPPAKRRKKYDGASEMVKNKIEEREQEQQEEEKPRTVTDNIRIIRR